MWTGNYLNFKSLIIQQFFVEYSCNAGLNFVDCIFLQGFLDKFLSEQFGYQVLGIETQESVVKTAQAKNTSSNVRTVFV